MSAAVAVEGLNHITRITRLLPETIRFYVEVLGFREITRPGFGFAGAWLYGYGIQIHLIENLTAPEPPSGIDTRANHIAFSVPDVEAAAEALTALGVPFRRNSIPDRGILQLFFRDPEGQVVEVGKYGQVDS